MATKIAIEPVFEADFRECSYGFRPKRSAKQALEVVRKACNNKGYYVVDADIEKFFDNVNQGKLMKLVEQRISDRRVTYGGVQVRNKRGRKKIKKYSLQLCGGRHRHPRDRRVCGCWTGAGCLCCIRPDPGRDDPCFGPGPPWLCPVL